MSKQQRQQQRPALPVLAVAISMALYGGAHGARAATEADADAATPPATASAEPASADAAAAKKKETAKELSAVVVTYQKSVERALDIKRETVDQVDYILAEDIGKFPDLNLAESLQRVPGITIARDAGEGRTISVRGLDSQFTRIRINGMEALSTTGGTDASGGNNRGRGFDFNVFASDLFNKIAVHKTASADVDEGSLGATVDLHTAHPFDFDGFTALFSAKEGYNDLSEEWNPRGAFLMSDTFADGRLGLLFSLAYTHRQLQEEGSSSVRWDNGPSSGNFAASSPFAPARLASTFHPRIPRYGVLGHDQERLGATASLQWEPESGTLFTLDMLFADFKAKRSEDFLEAISFSRSGSGKPQTVVRDGFVDANGNLSYGVFDNVDLRSESRYDELDTKFTQISLTGTHDIGDRLHLSGAVGHSLSRFDNPIQTTVTIDRLNSSNYSWDYRDDDRLPNLSYGFDVTNPANWAFANGQSEIRLRPNSTDNDFNNEQLDLVFDANEYVKFKGGLTMKKYGFSTDEARRASEVSVPNLPAGVSLADLTRLITFGNNLHVPSGTPTTWLAPDLDAFANLFNIYSNSGTFTLSETASGAVGNNRSVTEKDRGGYLEMLFDVDVAGRPLKGDLGVRYVRTQQDSNGFAIINAVPTATSVHRDYDDTLPSLNLVYSLTDDLLLRFGAAKVMARPGLGNLTPGVTVSVSGGNRVVTGGDPFLDPFRAKTADLAIEWYFDKGASVSAAYFYKDIESFVQTSRETRPYNTSGLPDSLLAGTGASPTDDFQFNIPVNSPGGKLRGVELNYTQPFTFLPEPFSGFGAILNYTYVDSKIQYVTSTGVASLRTDLTGLSKNAYNVTLFYERGPFSARVTRAHRDDYLTTVPGRNNNDVEGTKGTTNIDFSASYKLNDQMSVTFEGVNLSDEFNDQYVSSTGDRSSVYTHTGREYLLGFRYKF